MSRNLLSAGALTMTMLAAMPGRAAATTYEVGPGKTYANVGDVPLEALTAGDTVLIYYRATPYKEKFVIAAVGTSSAPVTIRGVLGPNGERPILDGNGATTRAQLNYPSRVRGVIKIGASVVPFADGTSVMPQWIVIENLEIRGAHNPNTFTGPSGATETYTSPASAIYVEFGENITVRNCDMNNNGNGFFVFSSDTIASRNILVEGNSIHDNGNVGSNFEHNVYVEAIGITFQYNHLGALLPGAGGNNLKDRSAGLVVRYNWIEHSNRQLDLVHAEDSALVRADPRYRATHVYGNVIIEHPNSGNNDICFYGGDGGSAQKFRKGDALLLQQHGRLRPHGQYAAVSHGHQRREHRRTEQHRLRHSGWGQPPGARQFRQADADAELVQDGLDAVRRQQTERDHHEQRHGDWHVARFREPRGAGLPSHGGLATGRCRDRRSTPPCCRTTTWSAST